MPNQMKATELHRLLHNALLFARKNDNLPMLAMVRIEFAGQQAVSYGTDQYALGVTRASLLSEFETEDMVIQLSRTDAENLLKLAKTSPRVVREVHISITEQRAAFAFTTGEAIAIELSKEQFPNVKRLFPDKPAASTAQHFGLGVTNLVKFTKVLDAKFNAITITTQGLTPDSVSPKPTIIQIGDDFIGLLMTGKGHFQFTKPEWFEPKAAQDDAAAA